MECPGDKNCKAHGVCMNLEEAAVHNDDLRTFTATT
jgi:hypothetical protein